MNDYIAGRWLVVPDDPCTYCAVWIGAHRHWLREDGTLGITLVDEEHWRELNERSRRTDL